MNSIKLYLAFFITFCGVLSSIGQQYPSVHYTTLDGLPNNAIRSLFMDSRSLLWIGTENGLSKLENGSFDNFNEKDGLAFNSCWAIEEDAAGHMWFGSYGGGLSKFDGEKFTAYENNAELINNKIRKLYSFKEKLFVGTENGLSVIDTHTNELWSINESKSTHPQNFIVDFFLYHDQIYYATHGNGIYQVQFIDNKPIVTNVLQHHLIYALGKFDDYIYSSNKGFLEKFSLDDFIVRPGSGMHFGKSIAWDYVKDNNGNLYTASWGIFKKDGGVYKIEDNQMINMSHVFNITSKVILSLAYDSERNILYAGANDKGLYAIRLDPSILFYEFDEQAVMGFEDNETNRIFLHSKGITIQNKSTKAVHHISQKKFKKIESDYIEKNSQTLPSHKDHFYELNFSMPVDEIDFYELHQQGKNFWVNSNIGIFEFDQKGNNLTYLPIHSYCIGFTSEGYLIESNPYGGVRIFHDPSKMKFTYYSDKLVNVPVQLSKIVSTDNALYFSSVFHGLYKWKDEEFTSLYLEDVWKEEKLKRLHHIGNNNLLIASEFGDVFVIQSEPFLIKEKLDRELIVGNSVLFLESYKDYLIIGTERGLNIYKDGKIRFFDQEQGLSNRLFLSAKVMDNELYVGTTSGYYVMLLDELLNIPVYSIKLAITALNINHEAAPKSDYSWFTYKNSAMDLPHYQNTLYIEFKAVGYRYPEKLLYRYRLQPNSEWSLYRKDTHLELPYLPYDNYEIEVEVFDRHTGMVTMHPLMNFNIHPPIYLRPWFILILIHLFILNLWGLYKFRINLLQKKEKRKAAIEKRLVETKLEALCSQMNPHFTFNAINSIQYFILKNDTDKALTYLGKFSRLIRNTLENSSKPRISLQEEIAYLQSYVSIENSRIENRVEFKMELDKRIDPKQVHLPPMLLQPFIENVFVHAFDSSHPDPKLLLAFHYNEGHLLTCQVIDNGIGINPNRANKFHESKGLKLVKERLQLLPGASENSVNISSKPGEGTVITITFAIINDQPQNNCS